MLWTLVAFGVAATVLRRLWPGWACLAGTLAGPAAVLAGMLAWVVAEPGERWFFNPVLLGLLLVVVGIGMLPGRWNTRNPAKGPADAERAPFDAAPERPARPDPLADATIGAPLHAEPASRAANPARTAFAVRHFSPVIRSACI